MADQENNSLDDSSSLHYRAARPLTRAQVRNVDYYAVHHLGYSGLVLMENAGRGVADVLSSHWRTTQKSRVPCVLIACAKGNNGGDGFVLARHLHLRQARVEVLLGCSINDLSGDAATNFSRLRQLPVPVHLVDSHAARVWLGDIEPDNALSVDAEPGRDPRRQADYVVDALLGTGAQGPPRPPLDQMIRGLNRLEGTKLSIDVPSGLDCESGEVHQPTFRADITCTLVAPKIGFADPEALRFIGQLDVLDIGLPWSVVEAANAWEIKNAC